jgi:hypothetical protein
MSGVHAHGMRDRCALPMTERGPCFWRASIARVQLFLIRMNAIHCRKPEATENFAGSFFEPSR